jgi:hypothetical protein
MDQKWQYIYPKASIKIQVTSKPSKSDHPALQNSVLWIIFAHLGSGSSRPKACGFRSTRLAHLHLRYTCRHRCQTLTVASGRPPSKKKRVDKAEDSDVEASLPNQPYVRSAVLIIFFWRAEIS